MKFLILLTLCIAAQQIDGSSINRNTPNVTKGVEEFRNKLVDRLDGLPDEFFDLERTINNIDIEKDHAVLIEEITNFRKELTGISAGMQDELFDIELALNILLSSKDKDDDSNDDNDDNNDDDSDDDSHCGTWYLGMNLNPADGHIMDYTTGWRSTTSVGSGKEEEALTKDYKNQAVWEQPANYISIARHQNGTIDAVKVFEFIDGGLSLFERFDSSNAAHYRSVVTRGGPIQEDIADGATHMADDSVFSVSGDLALNWGWRDNGVRLALTGSNLPSESFMYKHGYGLGGHFTCDPKTGVDKNHFHKHEIGISCPGSYECYKVQGTDHGTYRKFVSGPVYGNYAIYVSQDATTFPRPGNTLQLEMKQCH